MVRGGGSVLTSRDAGPFRRLPSNVLFQIFQYYLPPVDPSFIEAFPTEFRILHQYRANFYRKTTFPLCFAVQADDLIGVVQLFIDEGCDLDYGEFPTNFAPIHYAVTLNRLDIVKALVCGGASLYIRTIYKSTALSIAISQQKLEIFKYLLDCGADINQRLHGNETPLIVASYCPHTNFYARTLLSRGADISDFDDEHQTALMAASKFGLFTVVDTLLNAGADVGHVDLQGNTALILAAANSDVLIGEVLLKYGSKVNSANRFGKTALMLASNGGRIDWVNLLLKHGAEVTARDSYNRSALYMAVSANHDPCSRIRVIESLMDHNASLSYLAPGELVALVASIPTYTSYPNMC